MDRIAFGKRVKQARKAKGIRRGDFAAALNVSYTQVGHYEAGRNLPGVERLVQIAGLVGQPIDWICGIDEDGFSAPRRAPEIEAPRRRRKTAKKRSSPRETSASTPSTDPPGVPIF